MTATVTPTQAPAAAPPPAAEAPTIPAGPTDEEVMAKDQADMAAEIARITSKVSPEETSTPDPAPKADEATVAEEKPAATAKEPTALEKAERLAARHKARAEEGRRARASQEAAA